MSTVVYKGITYNTNPSDLRRMKFAIKHMIGNLAWASSDGSKYSLSKEDLQNIIKEAS